MSSAAEAIQPISYQYNKLGNVRAPINGDLEIMLDTKLVQQSNATPEYLASQNGQVGEARSAGFDLAYKSAFELGIETLNEITGQWRAITSTGTFAIVASFPA